MYNNKSKLSTTQTKTDFYLGDITELSLPSTMKIHFPDPDDILNFTLTVEPDEGLSLFVVQVPPGDGSIDGGYRNFLGIYKGGYFNFTFVINSAFPHEPPKVSRSSMDFL